MTESFSDIFSENDSQFNIDSEECNSESETVQKLKEQIEILQKENSSLASQFEGTIAIANQLETINSELSRTKNQNRQLIAENEDLTHRLELTIKSKNDLAQQINEERKGSAKERNENYLNARQEVEKQKSFYQKQLDAANDRVDQLIANEEANSVARKLNEGKIDRVVQSAQRFFNQEFLSFDDLAAFLSQPRASAQPEMQEQQQHVEFVPQQNEDDSRIYEVVEKLHATKEKARQILAANKKLESEKAELQKKIDEADRCKKAAAEDFEVKVEDLKKEQKNKDKEISELQRQVSALKVQTEKAQAALKEAEERLAMKPKVVVQKVVDTKKINEMKAAYEEEKEKMILESAELTQKLSKQTSKNEELSNKLAEVTEKLNDANKIVDKQENEIQAISIVRDNAVSDAQALRVALHQKQPHVEQKPQPKPLISKNELAKLKADLEAQKKENIALQIEHTKHLSVIDEQRVKIADLEQQVANAESETKKKAMDLNDALTKLNKKPEPTVEDVLPSEMWRTNQFGSEVGVEISEIASNSSLQPSSKLHAIYNAIYDGHKREVEHVDAINTAVATELQRLQSRFGKFLVDASVALTDNALTLDNFEQDGGENIVSGISMLRTNYDNMKHIFDSMQSTLDMVSNALGLSEESEYSEILSAIELIISQFNENEQLLEEEKKKFRILKRSYKEAAQKSQEREAQLIEEKEKAEKDSEYATTLNEKLKKEIASIKKEDEELNKKLNEVCGELEQAKESFESEVESRIQKIRSDCQVQTKELTLKLEEANRTIEENEKEIEAFDDKMKETQKKIFELANEKSRIASELTTTKIEMEENEKALHDKYEEEKQEIQNSFNSAVDQLREQCNNQSQDLTKLAAANSALETKIAKAKVAYTKIISEKKKIENESKFANEQNERDKRLVEVQCRSKIVAAENSFNLKLEELRSQQENDLRRIFTFAAENFDDFFNPSSTFNERNFRALLENVKNELASLSSSNEHIRRMLGASENQSTEDAVALLLLHRF